MEILNRRTYSLILKLIKRVWHLVKAKCLRNKYFQNFTLLTHGLDEFLDSLNGTKQEHFNNTGDELFLNLTTFNFLQSVLYYHQENNP